MASTSPFRTQTELITEVLANLGVLAAGQPIDPEDFNYVEEKVPSILRELHDLEIANVPDANNIPGAWFSAISDIVAGECAMKFGLNGQNLSDTVNKGLGGSGPVQVGAGTAAMKLKIMTRGRPTYERVRAEYF